MITRRFKFPCFVTVITSLFYELPAPSPGESLARERVDRVERPVRGEMGVLLGRPLLFIVISAFIFKRWSNNAFLLECTFRLSAGYNLCISHLEVENRRSPI